MESNESPEIPDRVETSDIPGLPSGAEDKNPNHTHTHTQLAVNISDTPVPLNQSQGHKTYNNNVDPKICYNHAKFESSCFDGVWEKANMKDFSKRKI